MQTEPIGFKEDADFQLKKDILLECIGTSDNLEFELIPGQILSFMVFRAMEKYAEYRSKKIAIALQEIQRKVSGVVKLEWKDILYINGTALEALKEAGL